jgi:hypothetical protein
MEKTANISLKITETTRKALAENDLVTFKTPEELFEDLGISLVPTLQSGSGTCRHFG